MRKTTEYNTENRLTVDIEGLMAMLSCGEVTAKKIADYAEAKVIVGRRFSVLYSVVFLMMHIPPFLRILLHHLPDSGYARCQYILF